MGTPVIDRDRMFFWLSNSGLGYKKQCELLKYYQDIEKLYKAVRDKQLPDGAIPEKDAGKLFFSSDAGFINKEFSAITAQGIEIITVDNSMYPELLRQESVGASFTLYMKGNLNLLNTPKIGIVGTRRCTDYGAKMTKQFSSALAVSKLTIVSGMAEGVDTIAHESALSVKGGTIAVLAGGFNHIYPASNTILFNKISHDGLLISEYPPSVKSTRYTFPARNRIISGLSLGVLVIEAGENSGSLITAELAVEQNRELFVIPGRLDSPNSMGTNRLLKSMPHAIVLSPSDILTALKLNSGIRKENERPVKIQLDILEEMVYNTLKDGEKHFNTLLEITKTEPTTLNPVLFNMEMKGIITKKAGNIYTI